jgi:hypothetical protein
LAWRHLEWRSVVHGVRECALVDVITRNLPGFGQIWAGEGLSMIPLYFGPGCPWMAVAVGKLDAIAAFARDLTDMDAMGRLLGYPACCRRMFVRRCDHYFATGSFVDGPGFASSMSSLDLDFGPTFHLPCRPDCRPTALVASGLRDVGIAEGFQTEMDWLLETTSWPVIHSRHAKYDDLRVPILSVRRARRSRKRVPDHDTCGRLQ